MLKFQNFPQLTPEIVKIVKIVRVNHWKDVKSQSRLSLTTEAYDKNSVRNFRNLRQHSGVNYGKRQTVYGANVHAQLEKVSDNANAYSSM